MTDPGASAGNQQPGVAEPVLPDPAVDPRAEGAASPPHDHGDASSQPLAEEVQGCGSTPGTEIVPAFQAGQLVFRPQYLDGIAETLAQARAALLARAVPALPKASIAGYAIAALRAQQAISTMAIPPDLGLFKVNLAAVSMAASLPQPGVARHILPVACDLGFHQAISTMVNSWDRGLLGINQQLAKSAAALAAPHQDLIRSMADLASIRAATVGSLADLAAMSVSRGLVDLFRSWRETAETGLGLLRGLARAAYRAALGARAAVLNGDDGPVAWFIEAWLHMRVTPARVEAVSAALLEEGWDAGIPEDPAFLLTDLRNRTARQARVLRPIWENQLNHQTIGMLDNPVTTSNGALLTVADLVRDPRTTEDLVLASECGEQRLRLVLSRLKPDELRVTNVYAERSELTWAEAARLAGAADPAAMGERIRRKLKRLGAEHNRRLIQAGAA